MTTTITDIRNRLMIDLMLFLKRLWTDDGLMKSYLHEQIDDIVSMEDGLMGNVSKDNSWMDDGSIDDGSMKSCGTLAATPGRCGNGDASSSKTPFRSSIERKTCRPKSDRFLSNSNDS
jgi:hypothetical protein